MQTTTIVIAALALFGVFIIALCKRQEGYSLLEDAAGPSAAAAAGPGKVPRATYPPVTLGGEGCGKVPYARDGTTPEDRKLVRYLAKTAGTFAKYLAATYPGHPATVALLQRFSGEVFLSTEKRSRVHFQTGCLVVDASGTADRPALVAKVLHLLAHLVSPKHDALFFETQRWFLRVASAELDLDIPVGCSVCCKFEGRCKDACPACRWTEDCATAPTYC
jgi:hypothetical protein